MSSTKASESSRGLLTESIAKSFPVDFPVCIGCVVVLSCLLAFADRWCPLPVAAEELAILVIILFVPLVFNLGFHRRHESIDKLSLKEDSLKVQSVESTHQSDCDIRQASLEIAFAEDKSVAALQRIATASFDGSLRIWQSSGKCEQRLDGHSGAALYSVSFSPDGKYVATGACDGTASIWVSETGARLHTFENCGGVVCSVAFSPCSTKLLTGADDHCMQLWSLNASEEQPSVLFEGHMGAVSSVAFSPCGAFVASGSHDATARLWSAATGACQQVLEGHDAEVLAIAYSPHCNMVATGSQDGTMRLWSAGAGWCILRFEGHEAAIRSLAFSRCGNLLCTGSSDGSAKLWDAQRGTCTMTFQSPAAAGLAVHSVAFSSDGATIATTQDNIASVWNVQTGACEAQLEGHTDIVHAVAICN